MSLVLGNEIDELWQLVGAMQTQIQQLQSDNQHVEMQHLIQQQQLQIKYQQEEMYQMQHKIQQQEDKMVKHYEHF